MYVSDLPFTNASIIAPLWSNNDVIVSDAIYYRVSQEINTLSHMTSLISTMNPGLSFQPRLCVVITWSSTINTRRNYFSSVPVRLINNSCN